jgi:hypothetical protein
LQHSSFLRLGRFPLYVYAAFCLAIRPSTSRPWVAPTFQLWLWVRRNLWDHAFSSFGFILGSRIARSYVNSVFSVSISHHTICYCGRTILYVHQQFMKVSVSYPWQHLFSFYCSHPDGCDSWFIICWKYMWIFNLLIPKKS